jgi:hypothetical protein
MPIIATASTMVGRGTCAVAWYFAYASTPSITPMKMSIQSTP